MLPSPEEQIRFIVSLQRLLDESLFTASYKFALLLALADQSVEKGDDPAPLRRCPRTRWPGNSFNTPWRQVISYPASIAGVRQAPGIEPGSEKRLNRDLR